MSCDVVGRWLVDNSSALNLQVSEAGWVKNWLPGYSDIQVEISVDSRRIVGSGIDKCKEMAFAKAGTEAIERAYCYDNGIHSSGVAAHPHQADAKNNAADELKERDLFLCHYLTKEPFVTWDLSETLHVDLFKDIQKRLAMEGVGIELCRMKTCAGDYAFSCFSRSLGESYGFSSILGLGYSDKVDVALMKGLEECLRKTIHYLSVEEPMGTLEFEKLSEWGPADHRNIFLTSKYKNEINRMALANTSKAQGPEWFPRIEFERIFSSNHLLSEAPIYVYRARSKQVQSMYYGPTKSESLNMGRLRRFATHPLGEVGIRTIPHCVG